MSDWLYAVLFMAQRTLELTLIAGRHPVIWGAAIAAAFLFKRFRYVAVACAVIAVGLTVQNYLFLDMPEDSRPLYIAGFTAFLRFLAGLVVATIVWSIARWLGKRRQSAAHESDGET